MSIQLYVRIHNYILDNNLPYTPVMTIAINEEEKWATAISIPDDTATFIKLKFGL